MNRIFFTGKTGSAKILFTPKGERIAVFPVSVEGFTTVQVLYLDEEKRIREEEIKGKKVMVFGTLMEPEEKGGEILKVKAKKIEFMEE